VAVADPKVDNSPAAQMQRMLDGCEKTYGKGNRAADCAMELAIKMAREEKRGELNAIYQRAR
jgi:hypothetical protein